MTGHNFYKLVLLNIVADAELTGEIAASVYLNAAREFSLAMEVMAKKARGSGEETSAETSHRAIPPPQRGPARA